MKTLKFSQADLTSLENLFSIQEDFDQKLPAYLRWKEEAEKIKLSKKEIERLEELQLPLKRAGREWNEVELESKFIAPLFMLSGIESEKVGYFMERSLEAEREGVFLTGIVDGLIAKGLRRPEIPYFCMQEYKKMEDPRGHADAQALAAMLAAQTLNGKEKNEVYGLFIIGTSWSFMVLEGNKYTISESFGANGKDIFEIFTFLKALRTLIEEKVRA